MMRRYSFLFVLSENKLELPNFKLLVRKTPMIYLSKTLDEIFAGFNKTTRNEIRSTENIKGLDLVFRDGNLNESYGFYKKIKRADGATVDLKREFAACVFFNGYYSGKMFVSVSCWDNGKVLRLKSIVSSRKEPDYDKHLISRTTRRLIWEICKYAKEHSYSAIDLGGINFEENAKKGLVQFKSSFGGEIVDIYIYKYETRAFCFLRKGLSLFHIQFT